MQVTPRHLFVHLAAFAAAATAWLQAPPPALALPPSQSDAPAATAPDRAAKRRLERLSRERFGRRAVSIARRFLGVPYRYGGASPSGFDCSGFVAYVYGHLGLELPHNAAAQFAYGRAVTRQALRPGDLVFFDGLEHMGIYAGEGWFIHAPQSGGRVRLAPLSGSWYSARFAGARRLLPPARKPA